MNGQKCEPSKYTQKKSSNSKDHKNKNKMNIFSNSNSDKNLKTIKQFKSGDKQKKTDDSFIVNFRPIDNARHCPRGCTACKSK